MAMQLFVRSRRGMSLLNLIVLLMLMGVLVAAGAKVMGMVIQRGKTTTTKTTMTGAVDAIISWAVRNGRLPTAAELQSQGIVPNPNDAWGKPLVYAYDANLSSAASGGLCGRTATAISYSAATNYVGFLLISGGNDYTITSTPGSSGSFSGSLTGLAQDDLYRIVTLEELKARAGCAGATAGRLSIANNELPAACAGNTAYSGTLFGSGGVPGYTWALISTQPSLPLQINSTSGVISFSSAPTAGTYTATFSLTDFQGYSVQRAYNLNVRSSCGGSSSLPVDTTDPTNPAPNIVGPVTPFTINNGIIEFALNQGNNAGCIWFPSNVPLLGKTLRAFWNFCYSGNDTSSTSTTYADGYTFTMMQASNPVTYCGTGTTYDSTQNPFFSCEYSGHFGEFLAYCGLPGYSTAIEFDIYPNTARNDSSSNYNHIAVVKGVSSHSGPPLAGLYGDNTHNVGGNPACNGSNTACIYGNLSGRNFPVTWMENTGCNAGKTNHSARVEVHTRCNSDCSQCETASCTTKYLVKAWIDRGNSDLNSNEGTYAPDLKYCDDLPTALNHLKVGLTQATGASVQYGYVSNLRAASYGSCSQPTISPDTLPAATVGVAYSQTLSGSGGTPPYANWAWTSSSIPGIAASNLPPGLSLNSSGVINGTPTTAGTYNTILVTMNDACTADVCSNSVSKSYTLVVNPAPVPSCTLSASPATVANGSTSTFTWSVTNGPVSGSWSTQPGGSCANFSGSSGGSCTSGSLTSQGTTIYTLTVTNAWGSATCSATVTVGCSSYRVWDDYDTTGRPFAVNSWCNPNTNLVRGNEITDATHQLTSGGTVTRYSSSASDCSATGRPTITYDQAVAADQNGDCRINYSADGAPTDR